MMRQLREEVQLTNGRVIVKGKLSTRGEAKRVDYVLYYRPNLPIAVVEAKDNNHAAGAGMQQALGIRVIHPVVADLNLEIVRNDTT